MTEVLGQDLGDLGCAMGEAPLSILILSKIQTISSKLIELIEKDVARLDHRRASTDLGSTRHSI